MKGGWQLASVPPGHRRPHLVARVLPPTPPPGRRGRYCHQPVTLCCVSRRQMGQPSCRCRAAGLGSDEASVEDSGAKYPDGSEFCAGCPPCRRVFSAPGCPARVRHQAWVRERAGGLDFSNPESSCVPSSPGLAGAREAAVVRLGVSVPWFTSTMGTSRRSALCLRSLGTSFSQLLGRQSVWPLPSARAARDAGRCGNLRAAWAVEAGPLL